MANPKQEQSRLAQIKGCVEWGDPLGKPGEGYSYSDTGYVLLGHIIERVTELPLPIAVRQYLKLDVNNIQTVMWERGDSVDVPHNLRVHQLLEGTDTYDWNPTVDLFGGGGLVANPEGMARFYQYLFGGRVFKDSSTLELMLSTEGLPHDSPYRLGVFVKNIGNVEVYEHSGFWGTSVMFAPSLNLVVSGAVVEQQDYRKMIELFTRYIREQSAAK